jgi:hypothetical protein
MRVVWVLVIACLVAATSARPLRIERRDPHAAHVEAAPATIAVVARREVSTLPDLRLAPFICAAPSVPYAPPLVAAADAWHVAPPRSAGLFDAPCARGPPIA